MWYYLHKGDTRLDYIHQPSDKHAFESFDMHYLVEQLLTFPDESVQKFFMRVCTMTGASGAWAMIDGEYYTITSEVD
jgi:hypothetical protein